MLAEGKKVILAVHSHKGGTGKTLISTNLATLLAAKGKKTCLLDMDFRAPSLHSLFKIEPSEHWLNDYLNGICESDEMLRSCGRRMLGGQLYVGFANPSTRAILEMSAKGTRWEMQALQRLLGLRKSLLEEQGFEYLILDTSPGLQHSSINSVVAADIALIVATSEESDIAGTQQMFRYLYRRIGEKIMLLFNKVPSERVLSEDMMRVKDSFVSEKTILCDDVGCFCDVPVSEDPCFFACEKEYHPFSRVLRKIVARLILLNICNEP
jgi:MinD-like ATPase involved in chromosome partitioning or flagellar assembly